MTGMMLFTPLSADQSERAISGDGFPDDTLYFVDKPDPDEATDDAVWVVIEGSGRRGAAFRS